jgi:hypothetical protein
MHTFDATMNPRIAKLVVLAAVTVGAAASAAGHPLRRLPTETRIVAPLADPALVPGVARCTSDAVCTVTDERGTRGGTPLALQR